ncbi:unnamed protein product [Paramecium pentaurelia]|uniref:Uncharacterized protein n=1 Tax=Paramecium pentaurelia TaxID=43138 RepID=A0A8S1TXA9_9CILI|nr:unnamed protein product [Paramecium pentaurelia]
MDYDDLFRLLPKPPKKWKNDLCLLKIDELAITFDHLGFGPYQTYDHTNQNNNVFRIFRNLQCPNELDFILSKIYQLFCYLCKDFMWISNYFLSIIIITKFNFLNIRAMIWLILKMYYDNLELRQNNKVIQSIIFKLSCLQQQKKKHLESEFNKSQLSHIQVPFPEQREAIKRMVKGRVEKQLNQIIISQGTCFQKKRKYIEQQLYQEQISKLIQQTIMYFNVALENNIIKKIAIYQEINQENWQRGLQKIIGEILI